MKQPLIVLTGPTAVGKTALSIRLAKAIGGEIVSADSMQVYRHMDIGSAKVTPGEMDGVPHYLIDVLEDVYKRQRQMGAVCINGLRTFLSERSGKSVKWIQVRDYIPVKSN